MSESQQIRDARTLLHEANSYFSMALGEGPLSCILFMNPNSHDFSLYKSEWSFSDFVGEPARKKLLNEAGKSGRPILILDASTDSRLADVRSCACRLSMKPASSAFSTLRPKGLTELSIKNSSTSWKSISRAFRRSGILTLPL